MIQMGINDPATSPGTWCIKGTYESLLRYKKDTKKLMSLQFYLIKPMKREQVTVSYMLFHYGE